MVEAVAEDDLYAIALAYESVNKLTEEEKGQLEADYPEQMSIINGAMSGQAVQIVKASNDSETLLAVVAPERVLEDESISFQTITGTTDIERISAALPQGTVLKCAYSMDFYKISKYIAQLNDAEEIIMIFHSSQTEELSGNLTAYNADRGNNQNIEIGRAELQNGSCLFRMNKDQKLQYDYFAIAAEMAYSDNYTTPDETKYAFTPKSHAVSTEGIEYSYEEVVDETQPAGHQTTNVVTVTIPKGFTGETVYIDWKAISKVFGEISVGMVENGQAVTGGQTTTADSGLFGTEDILAQPGDSTKCVLRIVNLSDQEYVYQDGSLWFDVDHSPYDGYIEASGSYPTFDGSSEFFQVFRTRNTALQSLNVPAVLEPYIEMALQDVYGPDATIADLPRYYLDYYNFKYGTDAEKLEDLPAMAIAEMFGGKREDNGWLVGQDVYYEKESVPELQTLAYNFFYNNCLLVNSEVESYSDSYGAYMAGKNYSVDEELQAMGTISSNSAQELTIFFKISGDYVTEAYQASPIVGIMGIALEQVVEEPSDPSDPEDPYIPSRPDPEEPSEPSGEEIEDPETPQTSFPAEDPSVPDAIPGEPSAPAEETESIDDEETPLAQPPQTGVKVAGSLAVLAGAAAAAGLISRKRRGK